MLRVLGFLGCRGPGGGGLKTPAFPGAGPQAHFKPLGWPALWTQALPPRHSADPGSLAALRREASSPCITHNALPPSPPPGLPANSQEGREGRCCFCLSLGAMPERKM